MPLGKSKIALFETYKNQCLFGKGLTLYHTITSFKSPEKNSFENIIGKGENAGDH